MKTMLAVLISLSACANTQNLYPTNTNSTQLLEKTVHVLSKDIGPRNHTHLQGLHAARDYIQQAFNDLGYAVTTQDYLVKQTTFTNIIVSLGPVDAPRIIVGAHYDTYGNQPGADDNASGVAGLIALAKQLKPHASALKKRIDLVAYTLEEPPYFRTKHMGSYIHAKSLHDQQAPVIGMLSLEMIGYFDEHKGSQEYPLDEMAGHYPSTGNFIALISNLESQDFQTALLAHMQQTKLKIIPLAAPESLQGVDFSDHSNYWQFDYNAVMVTDTAFFRNPHYHQATDTLETLNFVKMQQVITHVYHSVLNLALTP